MTSWRSSEAMTVILVSRGLLSLKQPWLFVIIAEYKLHLSWHPGKHLQQRMYYAWNWCKLLHDSSLTKKLCFRTHQHLQHFLCVWVHFNELVVESRDLDKTKNKTNFYTTTCEWHISSGTWFMPTINWKVVSIPNCPICTSYNHPLSRLG